MDDPIILNFKSLSPSLAIDVRKLAAVTMTRRGVTFYIEGMPGPLEAKTEDNEGVYNLALGMLLKLSSGANSLFPGSPVMFNVTSSDEKWSVDLRRAIAIIQKEHGLEFHLKGSPAPIFIPSSTSEFSARFMISRCR